ncbi:MAG: hypothetical protein B7733_25450 [Myxococcales bacterium FL481]|nr:MAG: hypothetical protein B7733_25450 [Myxococcales bacterium FL481]
MTLDDLLDGLAELVRRQSPPASAGPSRENFQCEECEECHACRFCRRCTSCEECTYCVECWDSLACIQCQRAVGCEQCSYVEDSRDCERSRYLKLCIACSDCVHCFACVGLQGAEFHVLNQPMARREYFALVKRLGRELEQQLESGWRPDPVWGAEAEEAESVAATRVDQASHDALSTAALDDEGSAAGVAPFNAAAPPWDSGHADATSGETTWAVAVARAQGRAGDAGNRPGAQRDSDADGSEKWLDDEENFSWLDDTAGWSEASLDARPDEPDESDAGSPDDRSTDDASATAPRRRDASEGPLFVSESVTDPDAQRGGLRHGRPPNRGGRGRS